MFRRKFFAVSAFVLKLLFIKFQLVCYVLYKAKHIITFDFVMLLQAKGNAVSSNPKHALECLMQFGKDVFQIYVLRIGYCSPSNFQLQAARRHFQS